MFAPEKSINLAVRKARNCVQGNAAIALAEQSERATNLFQVLHYEKLPFRVTDQRWPPFDELRFRPRALLAPSFNCILLC